MLLHIPLATSIDFCTFWTCGTWRCFTTGTSTTRSMTCTWGTSTVFVTFWIIGTIFSSTRFHTGHFNPTPCTGGAHHLAWEREREREKKRKKERKRDSLRKESFVLRFLANTWCASISSLALQTTSLIVCKHERRRGSRAASQASSPQPLARMLITSTGADSVDAASWTHLAPTPDVSSEVLHHRHVHDLLEDLDLWHLDGLLHCLNHWHSSLLAHHGSMAKANSNMVSGDTCDVGACPLVFLLQHFCLSSSVAAIYSSYSSYLLFSSFSYSSVFFANVKVL